MGSIWRDIGYAVRSLGRSPAFVWTAVLTIALGIGVNTAVFHLIYTVLLDPLPFREPQRLVHLAETHPDFPSFQVSAPDYADWRRMTTSFDSMAAHTFDAMNKWQITGDGEPEPVQTLQASHELFALLGIEPILGRTYTAQEEAEKAPVVVLSESLWRRKYKSDPHIVGRKIRLVTWSVEVIGVVSQRQAYPAWGEVWMPYTFLDPALVQTRRFHALEVIGRLKPGVSMEQAQAELKAISSQLASTYPDTNGAIGAAVTPLAGWITGEARPVLFVAWAAVLLVLLLACANVAHLVLVRTMHRAREMALRAALGAGSGRLARMLLVENLLVALAGGAIGAVLAVGILPVLLQRLAPGEIPRLHSTAMAPATWLFGLTATLVCALLFALPAIVQSRQLAIQEVIQGSGRISGGSRRPLFSGMIIAAELALAFAVITGAGLLYRSFEGLLHENTGFVSDHVLAAEVPLGFDWNASAARFEKDAAPRLRAIPGVTMLGAANLAPMTLGPRDLSRYTTRYGIAGRSFEAGRFPVAQLRWTTPDYFATLQIPLRRGRLFTRSDERRPGCLINESLARKMFLNEDPVGQKILMNVVTPNPQAVPILGVVGDVRDLGLDIEPPPAIYQLAVSNTMTVFLRTEPEPATLVPAVRAALRELNPDAPIRTLGPLRTLTEASLAKRRLALELLGVFALLAALLTGIGVYGVVSYSLSQREPEFAIRSALGAARSHMVMLIARGFALPGLAGVVGGAWLAYVFAGVLKTQLYKLSPGDPRVFAATGLAITTIVAAAAIRPAAKASAIRANFRGWL